MAKSIGQKLLDYAKQSPTDALKTASNRAIQIRAEATSYLIGNKIDYKLQKNHLKILETEIKVKQKYQNKDINLQKKDRKLLMN